MRYLLLLVISSIALGFWAPHCAAQAGKGGVSSSTVVNAPKEAVWGVLSASGHFDDQVQSVNGHEAIAEQKFKSLPFLGNATVLVKATATPMEQIEFNMIESDKMKAFSGLWRIAPIDDHHTRLHLKMNVDPGLPFPKFLINQFMLGKVKNRLKKVKTLAEKQLHTPARTPNASAKTP